MAGDFGEILHSWVRHWSFSYVVKSLHLQACEEAFLLREGYPCTPLGLALLISSQY